MKVLIWHFFVSALFGVINGIKNTSAKVLPAVLP